MLRKLKVADFGGEFSNIDTLTHDDMPSKQKVYQEDYQTKRVGDDDSCDMEGNGEFVHLHPTKGPPRYDMRKLKIVDEDSE